MNAKKILRAEMKTTREALGEERRRAADEAIARNLAGIEEYRQAQVVFAYYSTSIEVDTHGIIRAALRAGKRIALPRCVPRTRTMRWHLVGRIADLDDLERSVFGIDEPRDDPSTAVDPSTLEGAHALALAPALAFDERGYRLGYGGGFYDEFLAEFAGTSAGLCRDACLLEDLKAKGAVEPHDRPVNLVVTESRIARCNGR